MAEFFLHHYLLEIIRTWVPPLDLQIPTIIYIQAMLVKTDTIINMDSPLRKGPSPSNIDLSAPIHNVSKATAIPLPRATQMAFLLDLTPKVEKKCAIYLGKTFPPHQSHLPSSFPQPASPLPPPAVLSIMAKPAGAVTRPADPPAVPSIMAKPAEAPVEEH